jgi:hypothetical protein
MKNNLVTTQKPSTFYTVYFESEVIENESQFVKKNGIQKFYDTES